MISITLLELTMYFQIHPKNPQTHLIRQAADILRHGGVVAYPTDSCYALGCQIGDKTALERIRRIRALNKHHNLTLLCQDLSKIGVYAKIPNNVFRLMKLATPGPYTFLLSATRDVPKRLQHPKRKTIGIRVPDNRIILKLLEEIDAPILSTSLILPGDKYPLNQPDEIIRRLGNQIDLLIADGLCGLEPTTVLDMTGKQFIIVRQGKGDISAIGL